MRLPSINTLTKVSIYVGVAGITSIMYMRWKIEDRIRNTEYFRAAFKLLRQSQGAVNLLGEPIKEMGFDVGDANNVCDDDTAKFEVSVKGSKERGKIFFWATRDDEKGWLVNRLEMELKSEPDKRFIVKTQNDGTHKQQE